MESSTIQRYGLCCSLCHGKLLLQNKNTLTCTKCRRTVPIKEDVPNFIQHYQFSEFYAHKFTRSLPWGLKEKLFTLFHPSFIRYRFFAHHLKPKSTILDLGCGGGVAFLKQYGTVIGLELSHTAARTARSIYDYTIVAKASELPFKNNYFDAVVSLDVLGHIPLEEKKQVIHEIERVLKPGGITLHFSEADGQNPWAHFAKRSPELYQRYFIDQDGHYGILPPQKTITLFSNFEKIQVQSVYKFFTAAEEYVKRFDNEYKDRNSLIGLWVILCRAISRLALVKAAVNTLFNILRGITDVILPIDWGDGILLAFRKK